MSLMLRWPGRTWTALRPQRLVLLEPLKTSRNSKLCWPQAGQSGWRGNSMRSLVFSQTSNENSARLIFSLCSNNAGRCSAREWHVREDTAQTRSIAGNNVHSDAIGSNDAAVNPWTPVFDTHVIEKIASLEVVGGIKDKIALLYQCFDTVGVNVFDERFDDGIAIDAT